MTVSLALLVKDPPLDHLARLLEYVRPIVSETVAVVDDRTAGETVAELATWRDVTTIVPFRWVDDFSAGRNAALPHCHGDWILHLDPDEMPSPLMRDFIGMVDASEWVPFVDWYGQRHPDPRGYLFWTTDGAGNADIRVEHDWHCRLFRREHGRWYKPVHEQVALDGMPEPLTRGTILLPKAPRAASLRHHSEASPEKSELYARIEARV